MSKIYQYAKPPIENFIADDYVVSNLSLGAESIPGTDEAGQPFDGTKHQVAVRRFKVTNGVTVEEINNRLKERFGEACDLQYALDTFNTAIMTRPGYKTFVAEEIAAQDFDTAHRKAQELLDNYRVGRKASVGASVKVKVKKISALEKKAEALGISYDELIERAMSI